MRILPVIASAHYVKDGASAMGAEYFLHAAIRGIVYQQQVHWLVDIPGIGELFFESRIR